MPCLLSDLQQVARSNCRTETSLVTEVICGSIFVRFVVHILKAIGHPAWAILIASDISSASAGPHVIPPDGHGIVYGIALRALFQLGVDHPKAPRTACRQM